MLKDSRFPVASAVLAYALLAATQAGPLQGQAAEALKNPPADKGKQAEPLKNMPVSQASPVARQLEELRHSVDVLRASIESVRKQSDANARKIDKAMSDIGKLQSDVEQLRRRLAALGGRGPSSQSNFGPVGGRDSRSSFVCPDAPGERP